MDECIDDKSIDENQMDDEDDEDDEDSKDDEEEDDEEAEYEDDEDNHNDFSESGAKWKKDMKKKALGSFLNRSTDFDSNNWMELVYGKYWSSSGKIAIVKIFILTKFTCK